MKYLVTSTALAALATNFLMVAPAQAVDLNDNNPAGYAREYQAPKKSFSGFYFGGATGYGAVNYELDAPGFNFDGISGRGFQGCGIAGAQRQMGVFVVGVEGRGCIGNISTDLEIGGFSASLELDHSYAPYAKFGVAHGDVLTSALLGYRWQHYEVNAGSFSYDDTVDGFSGGLMIEKRLDDAGNWNIGLETLFTQFDEQDASIVGIDPTLFEGNIRLTYTFGQ